MGVGIIDCTVEASLGKMRVLDPEGRRGMGLCARHGFGFLSLIEYSYRKTCPVRRECRRGQKNFLEYRGLIPTSNGFPDAPADEESFLEGRDRGIALPAVLGDEGVEALGLAAVSCAWETPTRS